MFFVVSVLMSDMHQDAPRASSKRDEKVYASPSHIPRNVNMLHRMEQEAAGFNTKIAVAITRGMGTMTCAYIFVLLALVGFPGFHATATQDVQWISQTLIQLVALSILAVGQQVVSRHQELQSDEMFQTTMKSFHDIEQITLRLDAQEKELLKQTMILEQLVSRKRRPAKERNATKPL